MVAGLVTAQADSTSSIRFAPHGNSLSISGQLSVDISRSTWDDVAIRLLVLERYRIFPFGCDADVCIPGSATSPVGFNTESKIWSIDMFP